MLGNRRIKPFGPGEPGAIFVIIEFFIKDCYCQSPTKRGGRSGGVEESY